MMIKTTREAEEIFIEVAKCVNNNPPHTDCDVCNKIYVDREELIKIIKYQKINEYGSLIEGLCKKNQDYLLRKLGVDE